MASTDHLFARKVTKSILTTDGTATECGTITLPVATEGMVTIKGEAWGKEHDGSEHKYYERVIGHGIVGTGAFSLTSFASQEIDDPDTSGWGGVTLVESGDAVELTVDGDAATNIIWEGTLEVSLREQVIAGG